MKEITVQNVQKLKSESQIRPIYDAIPLCVGGQCVAGGFWRFFSNVYPSPGGIKQWNSPESWRQAWRDISSSLVFIGEDVFGNQLALKNGSENVWLWNHEDGCLNDLLLPPVVLLEAVLESNVTWIDFYSPEVVSIGEAKMLDLPENCHLHWTQPLILGGAVSSTNLSVVERAMHLKGHGELQLQLHGLPHGTEISIKTKK